MLFARGDLLGDPEGIITSDNISTMIEDGTLIGGEDVDGLTTVLEGWTPIIQQLLCLIVVVFLSVLAYWHRDKLLYLLAGAACLLFGFGFWSTATYLSILVVMLGMYNWIKLVEKRRG